MLYLTCKLHKKTNSKFLFLSLLFLDKYCSKSALHFCASFEKLLNFRRLNFWIWRSRQCGGVNGKAKDADDFKQLSFGVNDFAEVYQLYPNASCVASQGPTTYINYKNG